jgi:hypothetical protein
MEPLEPTAYGITGTLSDLAGDIWQVVLVRSPSPFPYIIVRERDGFFKSGLSWKEVYGRGIFHPLSEAIGVEVEDLALVKAWDKGRTAGWNDALAGAPGYDAKNPYLSTNVPDSGDKS